MTIHETCWKGRQCEVLFSRAVGHQCRFCLKQFAFASRLWCHLLMHQGQRPYSCVLCSRDFYLSADLERHLETHVNLGPTARADDVVDLYPQPSATRDASAHNGHLLEYKRDSYAGYFSLSNQPEVTDGMSTTDPWNKTVWNYTEVCPESEVMKENASSAFQSPKQQPRQGNVAKGKLHECLVCSKHFGSPYKLRRHQLIHTGERPFKCSLCDKAFTQLSHLKLHSQSHCRRDGVELPRVGVLDQSKVPTQNLSAEAYPTHLHAKTAISSSPQADAPEVAHVPCFTLADSSSSELLQQDLTKSSHTVHSPSEMIPVSKQHFTLQVKASYTYDDIPSHENVKGSKVSSPKKVGGISNAVAHNREQNDNQISPSYAEPKVSKVSCPNELDQTTSEIEAPSNLDDNDQMISSYASKLPKPCELLVTGQKGRSSQKGTYECQTCFKSFLVPSKLHRHMLSHTGQKPFACHICAKLFRQLCHLKLHLRTRVCLKQPNKMVKRKVRNISPHTFSRESGSLTIAPKTFALDDVDGCKTTAQNHSRLNTCVTTSTSIVNRARRKPSDSNQLMSHLDGCHSQYGSTNSDQMSKKTRSGLPQAVNFNTCRIVHECPVCLKCFSSPSKLKRHCLIHTGQRPFQCYMCQRAFRQLAHLKVHYRVHEQSGRKTPCLQKQGFKNHHHHSRASTPQQKVFTCNLCGWKFRHQTYLTVHLQDHKSLAGATPTTVSTQMKAIDHQSPVSSVLHKAYETPKKLTSSLTMCTGKTNPGNILSKTLSDSINIDIRGNRSHYCCSVCFKSFDCPSKLQRHSLCHSGQRPFKCLVCSKEFTQRAHLKVHRCLNKQSNVICNNKIPDGQSQSGNRCYPVHGDNVEPDNVSPIDGSSNRDQVNLHASLKRVKRYPTVIPEPTFVQQKTAQTSTNQQKGHPCTICQRNFSVPSKLARHLLIHMGIKPFTCQVCGRSFRQSCHLQTHLNVHKKRKLSRTLSRRESGNRQGIAFKPGHQNLPHNIAPLKENVVTKQNTIQKSTVHIRNLECRVSGTKAGESNHLPLSKNNKSSMKNGCDVGYVKMTVDQWHGTSSKSHSKPTGCVINETHGGHFVGKVNSCAPEFTSMCPIVHGAQNSRADAYPPENQIFIGPSCNDTTAQCKQTPHRHEQPSSSVETLRSIRKRANRCSICFKRFDSPSKLARHFLIHMGLKPYKCQVCSKSFRQLCHLQTHKKVHNKNTQSAVFGSAQSRSTSGDVEPASNGHVFDPVSHQGILSHDLHFPQMEIPHNKGQHDSSQAFGSFVNESSQSEKKSTDYGFASTSDHKQEVNHFMTHTLIDLPPTEHKQDFTDSKQNAARVSPRQLPQLTYSPQESKLPRTPPAYPTYSVMDDTLETIDNVLKAEHCHRIDQSDHFIDKWKTSGDDELGLAEGSHIPSTQPAQTQSKEEVFKLQFELEGVDSRLSKPPNDLLICPGCSELFTSERKLRTHKCVSRETEDLKRSKGGYQCAICFKVFQVPSKLKRHYVIHTGHRPFQCSVCSKTFTQSSHLKTHLNTHK